MARARARGSTICGGLEAMGWHGSWLNKLKIKPLGLEVFEIFI